MTLGELLREREEAIARRWLRDVLASYSADAARAFSREKNQFANPVGDSVRRGTQAIVRALARGDNSETRISAHLEEMIRIRAVQDFTPARAVGFVFLLKDIVRQELGQEALRALAPDELVELERQIDQIALLAFDLYTQTREHLCQLRINEVKRSTSWIMQKLNSRDRPTDRVAKSVCGEERDRSDE